MGEIGSRKPSPESEATVGSRCTEAGDRASPPRWEAEKREEERRFRLLERRKRRREEEEGEDWGFIGRERGGCFEVAATVWWWWCCSSPTSKLIFLPLFLFLFFILFLGVFWLFAFAEREKDKALLLLLDQIWLFEAYTVLIWASLKLYSTLFLNSKSDPQFFLWAFSSEDGPKSWTVS